MTTADKIRALTADIESGRTRVADVIGEGETGETGDVGKVRSIAMLDHGWRFVWFRPLGLLVLEAGQYAHDDDIAAGYRLLESIRDKERP